MRLEIFFQGDFSVIKGKTDIETENTILSLRKVIFLWKRMVTKPGFGVKLRVDVVREVFLGCLAGIECKIKRSQSRNWDGEGGRKGGGI